MYTSTGHPTFDDRDATILAKRAALLDAIPGPRVGDWIRFEDGSLYRISHLWVWGDPDDGAQISEGGSWYLGEGYVSFSGALYPSIPLTTLTRTDETRPGSVWFFHHNVSGAGRGVYASLPFRVYTTTAASTAY